MKKKTFDCVEMKRRGARLVRRRIKGMTPAEELAYWRRRGEELDCRLKQAKKRPRAR